MCHVFVFCLSNVNIVVQISNGNKKEMQTKAYNNTELNITNTIRQVDDFE